MKKQIIRLLALVLAAVCVFTLCSCSSGEEQTPYSVSQKILDLFSEDIEMTSLTSEQTAAYFGIDTKHLHSFSVSISSADDRYDTVAVFAYKDKEERTAVADAVAQHLKTNETTVKAVNDAEYRKIQNSLIMEHGAKLILVISDNNEEIGKMLEELGAKKFIF